MVKLYFYNFMVALEHFSRNLIRKMATDCTYNRFLPFLKHFRAPKTNFGQYTPRKAGHLHEDLWTSNFSSKIFSKKLEKFTKVGGFSLKEKYRSFQFHFQLLTAISSATCKMWYEISVGLVGRLIFPRFCGWREYKRSLLPAREESGVLVPYS